MPKPVLPILENLILSDGYLMAFNLSTLYRIPFDSKATLLIPFKTLKGLVSLLNADDDVTFSLLTDNGTTVDMGVNINGVQRYKLNSPHHDDFPTYSERLDFKYTEWGSLGFYETDNVRRLLKVASNDELRASMTTICFDRTTAVATDGHRLVYVPLIDGSPDTPFLAQKHAVRLMYGNMIISHAADKDYIRFTPDDGLNAEVFHRCVDERYPEWRNVIPTHQKEGTVNKTMFLNELRLAMIAANTTTHQVIVEMAYDYIKLKSYDLDLSMEYTGEKMPLKTDQAEAFRFGINGKLLRELLLMVDSEDLTISYEANNRAILFNKNVLLMPVMLADYAEV